MKSVKVVDLKIDLTARYTVVAEKKNSSITVQSAKTSPVPHLKNLLESTLTG
jgi:hypothetical protein